MAATALAVANLATGKVQQRRAVWLGWLLVLPVGSLVLHEAAARVAPPGHSAPVALLVLVAVLLVALFVAQTAVTLAPTFLLAAFYYLYANRPGRFTLFAVLAASCKEEMALLPMLEELLDDETDMELSSAYAEIH